MLEYRQLSAGESGLRPYSNGDYGDAAPAGGFPAHFDPISEEYARLHADIERASSLSSCFIVGVTSAIYGEGKTTVAMNLAETMARNSNQRVTLLDLNLRSCDLQERLNLSPCLGLVDLLESDEDDVTRILRPTHLENLAVVPAGRTAAAPARLARSDRLGDVIGALRQTNEFVIVDMGPVLPVADTRVQGRYVDGFVMVVRAGVTPRETVARGIESVGGELVLGVVLNGVESAMPTWLRRYLG